MTKLNITVAVMPSGGALPQDVEVFAGDTVERAINMAGLEASVAGKEIRFNNEVVTMSDTLDEAGALTLTAEIKGN